MFDNERFRIMRKEIRLTQKELAIVLGIKQGSLSDIERGKTNDLSTSVKNILKEKYNINIDYLYNLSSELFNSVTDENLNSEFLINSNGNKFQEKSYGYDLTVKLLPFSSYASYSQTLEDVLIAYDFEEVTFSVEKYGLGNYLAFKIKGDSMNGGGIDDTKDGALVLGREVGRHLWINGFHKTDYGFIILSKKNIYHKDIVSLDKTNGNITCRSRNKESKDFEINLNDCYQIFKVIKRIQ